VNHLSVLHSCANRYKSLDIRLQALHRSAKDCIDGQNGAVDKLDKDLALLGIADA
jgi:hypothetical protein